MGKNYFNKFFFIILPHILDLAFAMQIELIEIHIQFPPINPKYSDVNHRF